MGRWIFKSLALLLGLGLLLVGVVSLGRSALDQLRARDRYQLAFADIECIPPPGMIRADFLDEVQYCTRFPDQVSLLDHELPQRLAQGFVMHPWVEKVERVEVTAQRQIHVRLVHRTPVLAVQTPEGIRVLDGQGIVLPRSAPYLGLPLLHWQSPPPKGPAGTRWGDPEIETAARAAARRRS